MKKRIIFFLLFAIAFTNSSQAQRNEIYLRSNFISFTDDKNDIENLNSKTRDDAYRSSTDVVLGFGQIKKNSTQFTIGLRIVAGANRTQRNDSFMETRRERSTNNTNTDLGFEVGIGKRIAYKKLLFIPSVNLNLFHSVGGDSRMEEYEYNQNNLVLHNITDAAGGKNFTIATTLAQGIYYKLGDHWKLGGELNAQIGYSKYYGTTIQSTRDVINNQINQEYITKSNDRRFSLNTGIQLGIRYTL